MPRRKKTSSIGYRRKKSRITDQISDELSVQNDDPTLYADFFLSFDDCDKTSPRGNTFNDSYIGECYLVADKVLKISPDDDEEAIYLQRMMSTNRYHELFTKLQQHSVEIQTDTSFFMVPSSVITFFQIHDSRIPGVKCVVNIDPETFFANVFVHRQQLSPSHDIWKHVSRRCLFAADITILLQHLSKLTVCMGNPDEDFRFVEPGPSAFRENDFGAICGNVEYNETIRHIHCELLVQGIRCEKCVSHRGSLRKKKSLESMKQPSNDKMGNTFSKRTTHKNMSKEMLCEKVNALQTERYAINAENTTLKKKLQKAIETSSKMSEGTNDDIHKMVVLYPSL